jgi:NAD(P)-dependent dehydrogenase (short-subunit alcohol dehydrogenase family)
VVHGIHAVYPVMIRQHSGHIVNTASMAGLMTNSGQASYGAAKHAVVALSNTLRLQAAHHGVKASVLCPGVIRTPILTGGKYGRLNMGHTNDEEILKSWEPAWWKVFWYVERLSPALSMRLAGLTLKRLREIESKAALPTKT